MMVVAIGSTGPEWLRVSFHLAQTLTGIIFARHKMPWFHFHLDVSPSLMVRKKVRAIEYVRHIYIAFVHSCSIHIAVIITGCVL